MKKIYMGCLILVIGLIASFSVLAEPEQLPGNDPSNMAQPMLPDRPMPPPRPGPRFQPMQQQDREDIYDDSKNYRSAMQDNRISTPLSPGEKAQAREQMLHEKMHRNGLPQGCNHGQHKQDRNIQGQKREGTGRQLSQPMQQGH
ncbi:MAG TPA: hypothetical protein VHA13_04835 [Gammaproteobacteria bacterium]|nr:hypothetical protein [Gammaproteobacteria bacterium]